MAMEVKLPKLGKTMEEASIVNFLFDIDDQVKKGDIVFEIETDKATLEVESPAEGFIKAILVEPGHMIPVGQPVLIIGEKDETIDPVTVKLQTQSSPAQSVPGMPEITEEDISTAIRNSEPLDSDYKLGSSVPLSPLQKITAANMLRSKREIPCFYLNINADVTELVKTINSEPSFTVDDYIIKSVAQGLKDFPIMTGQIQGESIFLAESINIGIAVGTAQGMVPVVIKEADQKSLTQIALETKELTLKANGNKLDPADTQGAVINISNLGACGIDSFIPIVYPGQCSALGIGQIAETCIADNGNTVIKKIMNLAISVDHKVANGAYAAQFLDSVKRYLESADSFD